MAKRSHASCATFSRRPRSDQRPVPKEVRWPLCADLGGLARGDAQQLLVGCREDVVGVATRRPHLVVSRERDVDDGAQRLRMTNGGNTTCGFGNLFPQTEPGLASQVGFYKFPVLGISYGDLARNRQVVSGLLRTSQGSK